MKKILVLISALALVATLFSMVVIKPDVSERQMAEAQKILTPWAIETFDDGTSKVLGIHLNKTILSEVVDSIGPPDSIALFAENLDPKSIEIFFNKAPTGPLGAKLVVTIKATKHQALSMMERSTQHTVLGDGTRKFYLQEEDKQTLLSYIISSITLVPSYQGLDAQYFLERFGEPTAKHKETEAAVSWFYPEKGLTLLIDDDGKEVFQYQAPVDFTRESPL